MFVVLKPSKRQKVVFGVAGLAACLVLAFTLVPDLKRWSSVFLALVREERRTVWEGLDVEVGPRYVLLRGSHRLRVIQVKPPDEPGEGRSDLMFWRSSAQGLTNFAEQRQRCVKEWAHCKVLADSSPSPRWECIRPGPYGAYGPRAVLCLLPEPGISALYTCVGPACADFRDIVRRSFTGYRPAGSSSSSRTPDR